MSEKLTLKPVLPPESTSPKKCEFEEGCDKPARKLVAALLHRGTEGTARAWICDDHFSKLQLAPPFSMLSLVKEQPK